MLLRAALAQCRHGMLDGPTAEAFSLPGGDTALPWCGIAPGTGVTPATGTPAPGAAAAAAPQHAAPSRPYARAPRAPD